jgi:hypothetical protein
MHFAAYVRLQAAKTFALIPVCQLMGAPHLTWSLAVAMAADVRPDRNTTVPALCPVRVRVGRPGGWLGLRCDGQDADRGEPEADPLGQAQPFAEHRCTQSCRADQRPSRSGRSTLRMSGSACIDVTRLAPAACLSGIWPFPHGKREGRDSRGG